jgi:hypothetical protein
MVVKDGQIGDGSDMEMVWRVRSPGHCNNGGCVYAAAIRNVDVIYLIVSS